MMKSWKKECSATTLLSQVFGAKLLGEAETLMQESDWCDLICEPPYRRKGVCRCKNPKASQKLDWFPFGIVGKINIDDDVFSRCFVRREESQPFDPDSILSYHSSEAIDNMFYWYTVNGYGVLSDKVPNTGLYVKMKLDGSKLQIISDRSSDYPLLEREFFGDVENVVIKGLCIGQTDYLNRVGSRKTEGFDS